MEDLIANKSTEQQSVVLKLCYLFHLAAKEARKPTRPN